MARANAAGSIRCCRYSRQPPTRLERGDLKLAESWAGCFGCLHSITQLRHPSEGAKQEALLSVGWSMVILLVVTEHSRWPAPGQRSQCSKQHRGVQAV